MTEPIEPQAVPPTPTDAPADPAAVPPKKKRRLWPKILIVLVIALVLLVLLLPTIISLAPFRAFAVGKANGYLNGRLEVASWSFGWFSGTKIDGVKVFDKDGTLVAVADRVETDLSLLKLIRQDFDLGHTVVDVNATKLVVYPDGSNNYGGLVKKSDKPAEPKAEKEPKADKPAEPISVPNVKGDIELHLRGSAQLVDANGKSVDVQLRDGSGGTIKIADINQGVSPDLKLIYDVAGKGRSEVDVSGTVDAIENNKLDLATLLQTLSAKLKIALNNVDFGAAQPLLAMAGKSDMTLAGVANGGLDVDLQPGKDGVAKGEIVVTNVVFAGPQIPDTYKADTIHIPINVTRSANNGKVRDAIDIKTIVPEVTVAIAGDVPEDAILNLQKQLAPGDTGWLSVTTTVDPAKAAASLPKTLHVLPDVRINGGQIVSKVDVAIQPDGLITKTQTNLAISGVSTKDNSAIAIPPVNISTNATLAQFGLDKVDPLTAYIQSKLPFPAVPGKLSVVVASDFANFSAGGDTLTQIQGDGSADLDKLQKNLSQFFDLGNTKLAGQADFTLKSKNAGSDLAVNTTANVNKLQVVMPGYSPLDVPFIKLVSDAALTMDGTTPTAVSKTTTTLQAGNDPAKPLLDSLITASAIDLKTMKIGAFKIDHFTVTDAAELQRKFIDPFVPALKNQKIAIEAGQIYFVAAGSADMQAKSYALTQCEASMPHLRISKDGKTAIDDDIKFNTTASVMTKDNVMQATVPALNLKSALLTVTAKDIQASPPADGMAITTAVPSAMIDINAGDFAKLQAVTSVFGVALPYNVSGSAVIHTAIKDGTADVTFTGNNVAIKNDKGGAYAFDKPLTFNLTATAKGSPKIDQIDVSKLSGDFGVATIGMPQPISVTNLSTSPVPSGQIELAGAIEKIAPLLQVIQSADAPMPYKGLFKFRQSISTKGDDITLKGDGTVDNFAVADATGKTTFSEKQVTIANDLTANPKMHHATITNFSAEMTASQAAKVTASGSIANWDTTRTLEGSGLPVKLKYDLAKLWPIVYAMMSPDMQKDYADAKVVGAFEKTFTLTGSYPVAKTIGESIKPLKADGSIEVTQFTSGGIDLHDLLLNLALAKGVATVTQQPAKINDGTLSLNNVQVDLTQSDLRLFTPRNLQLVSKASINPALGNSLGKFINPTFANAKQAKGLLSVTVNECRSLALSPATLQSPQSGTVSATINIQDMDIANPVGSLVFGKFLDQLSSFGIGKGMSSDTDTFQGELKDGKVTINKGVADTNLVMTLSKPVQVTDPATGKTTTVPKGMPLGFAGTVTLKTLEENLKVSIPSSLIASMAGADEKKITDVIGESITIPLKGQVTAPKPEYDKLLSKIGENLFKSKVTGDNGDGKSGLDSLLNKLDKKKKKKDSDQ